MIRKLIKLGVLGVFLVNSTYGMNLTIPKSLQNNMSVMVIDTKTTKVVYEHLPNTPRLIASNMKLITTAVGLEQLHPDFKWHTKLFYKGSINNGVLEGDLYILGGGDPTLDDRALNEIFSNLYKLGIKKISGNLVIDNTIFNSLPTYSMLKVENYDIDTVFPDGLIVDANKTIFNIHVKANTTNIDSNLYGYNINNQLNVDPNQNICSHLSHQVSFKKSTVTFSGKISRACNNQKLEFNMIDTKSYTKMALSRTLNNLSIELKGNIVYQNMPDKAILIYDYSSQTLEDAMVYMNHYSVNIIAETVFLSLGAFTTNNENTSKNSKDIYYSFMKKLNMLNPNFRLENGAGLSRTESVTATGMANLLKYENNSQYATIFEKTLPQSGLEGSLKNNFTKFGHRAKFKTGTLNDTHAYSGYFLSRHGSKYIVVAIANNINTNSSAQMNRFNSFVTKLLDKLDKN
jgi:D-alanyl-D-alanine carboxypeptidase/D-alanyl-D-alanine-endopeptidase (penicillin-binding protein 4)